METYPVTIRDDDAVTRQQIKPGTIRRILPYARPYRSAIAVLLCMTVLDAVITVVNPLILGLIIDDGILRRRLGVVVGLSLAIAGLALAEALAMYVQGRCSVRIGEGLVYELRTSVFRHVQRQPLAFFTRTQTGSLVSRLNNDVNEAQRAVELAGSVWLRTLLTLVLVLAAMFYLSWQISILALAVIPLFIIPGRLIGSRQQRLVLRRCSCRASWPR